MINQSRLKELFTYTPDGKFTTWTQVLVNGYKQVNDNSNIYNN